MERLTLDLEGLSGAIEHLGKLAESTAERIDRAVFTISMTARDMVQHALRAQGYTTIPNDIMLRATPGGMDVIAQGEGARKLQFLLNGTAPHRIAAVHGQALRFPWGGGIHFYRSVQHPGTPGKPVLQAAFDAIRAAAVVEIDALQWEA